jgi:hypothetical protein
MIPFGDPVFIVPVIDVDRVSAQEIEVGLRLVPSALNGHGP